MDLVTHAKFGPKLPVVGVLANPLCGLDQILLDGGYQTPQSGHVRRARRRRGILAAGQDRGEEKARQGPLGAYETVQDLGLFRLGRVLSCVVFFGQLTEDLEQRAIEGLGLLA
jgi:hypothetical protein